MKKILIFLNAMLIMLGLLVVTSPTASASKIYYNHVPSVLRHTWQTKTYKTQKKYSSARNRYWYTSLSPSNTDFHLEDFMLNKHKGNEYNSGPYGPVKGYWALAYEKISAHRFYVMGTVYYGSKKASQYGVIFSKNYKSLKLYSFNVKVRHNTLYSGKAHYVGKFYRQHVYYGY